MQTLAGDAGATCLVALSIAGCACCTATGIDTGRPVRMFSSRMVP